MHYTSVENIMKVIRPLFLDDLQDAFDAADTKAKLSDCSSESREIKCFDPACGSGNFLVIAYKELRKLEHRILERLQEIDPKAPTQALPATPRSSWRTSTASRSTTSPTRSRSSRCGSPSTR